MKGLAVLRYHAPALLDTAARSYKSENARESSNGHLCALLDEAGYLKLSGCVSRCNAEYRALRCSNGHSFKAIPTYRCNYRLCAFCARERQRRTYARLSPVLEAYSNRNRFHRPILITLTVKSSHEPLRVQDKRFKACFRKLRLSAKWKHHIAGAVAGFEFTYSPTEGWHYHVHILAFRKTVKHYRQEELLEQWTKITGGAGRGGVNIQSKGTLKSMTEEVLKYVTKPTNLRSWGAEQVFQFNQLKRVKLSECYGELRGLKLDEDEEAQADAVRAAAVASDPHAGLEEGSPCPCCAEPLRYQLVSRALLSAVSNSPPSRRNNERQT